ncbi:TAXI family TRAP transporter solute-binding subunit [Nonomuraea cavernae]|uniref:C4-dicarboxylate ABC transporter substrate-binding protein n=1 Tax=Nonomuraea cavernae TaxID=2045107 RepID=A0A917YZR8_9ACTN|nr:TAXI family TRAP transporter solute-binding subunit [Nonomuraea cavernae]MCA2186475.1 TAXI family TRAP transporter solute-binding subunit [Nonomuraea cavernae]GGO71194.1 C4-dicarboxylate ABC transporter substrate-binding protein [Nonomuraea cavernae]
MKRIIAVFAASVLAAGAAGCGGGAGGGSGNRLSIATGGTTGVYYVYGGGLAKQLTANIANTQATASVTSASIENIKLLATGKADIGFSQTDTAADAVGGTGSFTAKQPVKAIARIYDNYAHVVVAPGVEAAKVADLKGKKVSLGPPNSGTQVVARRMLEAAGLNPDTDISKQQLSINESVQAVKDGTIDAFFWVGGLPTAGVVDLATSKPDMKMLDTADALAGMQAKYGKQYVGLDVDLSVYKLSGTIKTVGVANVLLVPDTMNEQLAYDITRTLFEKKTELTAVHPEAAKLDPALGRQVEPVALHPGAARYFKEKG